MQNVYKISTCWHCSKDAGCYCFFNNHLCLIFLPQGNKCSISLLKLFLLYRISYLNFCAYLFYHVKNLFWTAQILQRKPVSSPNFNSCLYFLGTRVFYFIYSFIYLIYGNSWIFFITLISFSLEVIDILGLKLDRWQKDYFVRCCNNIKSN